uniref:Odorant-binding protein AgamOBP32 n=1 Tax=Rhabditophanes sp. KR3021 TaxID=114890 RepID=A0AC35UGQ2_9BILA
MNLMQNLMKDGSSQWTVDLVTPLQSLLAGKNDLKRRMETSCDTHNTFINCLNTCGPSKALENLKLGQESWDTICYAYDHDKDFKKQILPCWQKYGDQIAKQCHIHALMVQNSVLDLMQHGFKNFHNDLSNLCRSTSIYDKCYIWQTDRFCGEKGWVFLLKLSQKTSITLAKMLNQTGLLDKLPPDCEQWIKPEEYTEWHIERLKNFRQLRNSGLKINLVITSYIVLLFHIFLYSCT